MYCCCVLDVVSYFLYCNEIASLNFGQCVEPSGCRRLTSHMLHSPLDHVQTFPARVFCLPTILGTEGLCNPSVIFCMLSVRRRRQGVWKEIVADLV